LFQPAVTLLLRTNPKSTASFPKKSSTSAHVGPLDQLSQLVGPTFLFTPNLHVASPTATPSRPHADGRRGGGRTEAAAPGKARGGGVDLASLSPKILHLSSLISSSPGDNTPMKVWRRRRRRATTPRWRCMEVAATAPLELTCAMDA
jgi:hypothetical protein